MADPTRPQIEATIALPTFTVEVDQGAGYAALTNAEIKSLNAKLETTSNIDNAFAFGTVSNTTATVETTIDQTIADWELARVRIRFGFDTSDKVVAFEGIITNRQRNGRFYTYECSGFDYIIARKKAYTDVFYRRPIATATSATSNEDIGDIGYRGGLLNYIMWVCGGRPYEQPGYASDPDFKFWYSFNQSIVAPRYSWLSGENAWNEIFTLVRAAGGQFYQDVDGVYYYRQPLTFGEVGVSPYHFTESTYYNLQEAASTAENTNTVVASFVKRVLQPMQKVYESSDPQLLPDSEVTTIPLQMQYPVYTYADYVNSTDLIMLKSAIKATYLDGRDATADYTLFTVSIPEQYAQLLTLDFDNQTGEPIALSKILIEGRPITAGAEGTAKYTDSTEGKELQLEDNPYIQSYAQAYRLVRMVYDFSHDMRPVRTLQCGYDPDRRLGEVVLLSNTAWGLSSVEHRIIALEYINGAGMVVTLAPIDGLITRDDVFIVGNTYSDGTTKQVSY